MDGPYIHLEEPDKQFPFDGNFKHMLQLLLTITMGKMGGH